MKLFQNSFFCLLLAVLLFACKKQQSGKNETDYTNIEPDTEIGATGTVWINYNGKKNKYTTVRAKDGNVWLQQNLGAGKVAQNINDTFAFGDYFQWGRWDDGHQLYTPEPEVRQPNILPINNPSGLPLGGIRFYIATWWNTGYSNDKWEAKIPTEIDKFNGCDPCKAIGENWRLPTDNEWDNIFDLENITDAESAFHSNLKITSAGWRSAKSIFLNEVNQSSRFWSSTSSGSNAAKGVFIKNHTAIKSYVDSRSYGMSIRCLRKI